MKATLYPGLTAALLLSSAVHAQMSAPSAASGAASQAAVSPDLAQSIASDPFVKLDKNRDGFVSKDEANRKLRQNWAKYDSNNDGKIDSAEFAAGAN